MRARTQSTCTRVIGVRPREIHALALRRSETIRHEAATSVTCDARLERCDCEDPNSSVGSPITNEAYRKYSKDGKLRTKTPGKANG